MDVGGAPAVGGGGVGGGADGLEGVCAVRAGGLHGKAGEIGVDRGVILFVRVAVAALGVGLPDFHAGAGEGFAVCREDAAVQVEDGAACLAAVGEVAGGVGGLADGVEGAEDLVGCAVERGCVGHGTISLRLARL